MLELRNHYFGFADDDSKLTGGSIKSEDDQTIKNDSDIENNFESIVEDKDTKNDASNESQKAGKVNQSSVQVTDETTLLFDNTIAAAKCNAAESKQANAKKNLLHKQRHISSTDGQVDANR